MRKLKSPLTLIFFFILAVTISTAGCSQAEGDTPRMTTQELNDRLAKGEVVVIDVRSDRDWSSSDSKIKGAVREEPGNVDSWIGKYPKDKALVFYCA